MAGGLVDVEAVRRTDYGTFTWRYTERDVALYALSLGCRWSQGRFVYEGAEGFAPLPMFGVIPPYHELLPSLPLHRIVPKFNPMLLLHGEQYLELGVPFPTAGTLRTSSRILDIQDKGKAAVVVIATSSIDEASGKEVAYNESTTFLRGAGGFRTAGPATAPARRRGATTRHALPDRPPDAVVEERTGEAQAALYRLNGDYNPLHIDPEFAALGGFDRPILHGLCTYGVAAKHVLLRYGGGAPGAVHSIKGRFAAHVFPGETLRTEMWLQPPCTVLFQTRVVERDALAVTNAAVVFREGGLAAAAAKL
ncbi:hypothetical protein WJX81_001022 [Elliptochloris bilobata]|uniref:MaoC-like domain-containing protein n=1 Tax=Elliptochloris bilobata TaxID=381761 RepID=A0AAW1REA1_9CHLO